MIKVRVRTLQAGLPIASGLIALSTLSAGLITSACAPAASEDDDNFDAEESALTVANPGTGVFELGWAYGTPTGYSFTAKNSTDEYVRGGEKMTFTIPAHFLWSQLHPSDALPQDIDRLKKLSAKISIAHIKYSGPNGTSSVKTSGWQGEQQVYSLSATSSSFTVSRHAKAMRFTIEITDDGVNPPVKKTLDQNSFFEVPVIGGALPSKTLLFDNYGRDLRSRVLEGGNPVRGAELSIAYTDWRAATLVDTATVDRSIGTATSYGRFGSIEMPIYGEIEYEISYGVAIDSAWQGEKALTANGQSRLLPTTTNGGRTAWEGTLAVPANAQALQIYFHVKAFLKVDYSKFSNIRSRKYNDGERLLVRERWDNENGATNDNYDFATESK